MNLKKIKLPHNKIKEGTNVEGDHYFMSILEKILIAIGTNVLVPRFKFNPQLIATIFMTHILALSFIIMMFTNLSIAYKLESFCVGSAIYQGIHKMYTAILYPKQFVKLRMQLQNLHLEYSDDPAIAEVLKRVCSYCSIGFEILVVVVLVIIISYILLPIFMWKKYEIMTTILPIHLPFLDWETSIGYTINTINHLYALLLGVAGIIMADVIFLYFVLHSIGYVEILGSRLTNLDNLLECNGPQNVKHIENQLNKCIQAHQDYMTYVRSVDNLYAQLCLAQLVTSQSCLTLSLLLTMWRGWILGPFIVIGSLCQILQYCLLGTVVTVQNERASQIIYNFKWYLLPVQQQKLIVLMILRAQTAGELNAGSFAKLNVGTCMVLLKSTYTFVMMMLEFLRNS